MKLIWLLLLLNSVVILTLMLFRVKISFRWFGYLGLNIVFASVILYIINASGFFADFRIPINEITVLTVGILGIPGLLLLIALRLTLF